MLITNGAGVLKGRLSDAGEPQQPVHVGVLVLVSVAILSEKRERRGSDNKVHRQWRRCCQNGEEIQYAGFTVSIRSGAYDSHPYTYPVRSLLARVAA